MYRGGMPQTPPTLGPWYAGWIGYAGLAIGGVLAIGTGVAAYFSESSGMTMAMLTAGPLAFGAVTSIVARVTRWKQGAVRIAAPLGCGCGAALFASMFLFVFFATIWRSL